jgi:hypothetical protein
MLQTFYKYLPARHAQKKVGDLISPSYAKRVTEQGGLLAETEQLLEEYRPSDKPSRYDSIFVGQNPKVWERTMGRTPTNTAAPALALVSPLPGAAIAQLDARFYEKVVQGLRDGDADAARKAAETYWTADAVGPNAGEDAVPEFLLESGGTFEGFAPGHKPKPDKYFLDQIGPPLLDMSPKTADPLPLTDRVQEIHAQVKTFRDRAITAAGGERPPDWEFVTDQRMDVREHRKDGKSIFNVKMQRPNANLSLSGSVRDGNAKLSLDYHDLWRPERSCGLELGPDGLEADFGRTPGEVAAVIEDFRLGNDCGNEGRELVQGFLDALRESRE